MQILDVDPDIVADVSRLNEAAVPHVSSVSLEEMKWFVAHAHYFRIACDKDKLLGFLIGLRPGLDYTSPNYRWFNDNYEDFGYIDRVAVSESARRRGIASRLYDDFAETISCEVDVLTCEVNIRPPNETSMTYHVQRGFVQVATQETEGGKKEVALLEMRL
jgi:predicted GNAT superfamily acetyltransferase